MAEGADIGVDAVDLLRELVRARVDFIIVGAHALAAHGLPRATGDLDVFIASSAVNARRVHAALVAFGAPLASHGVEATDFETPRFVYQIGLPPNRIDLLTSIDGVPFEEARASRLWAQMEGFAVPFLGRSALIKNKRAAARPKDLVDVTMLERWKR